MPLDRPAFLRTIVIGEIGVGRRAHENLALCSGRHVAPVVVQHAHGGSGDRPADRAGMRQPFGRVAMHRCADLGPAIGLVQHGSPPIDHLAFDFHRAWRSGVGHPAERSDIVAPPHLRRELEQAHEHGRHHDHVRDPLLFDHFEQPFRLEPGVGREQLPHADGHARERVGRGVVQRPAHIGAHALRDAIDVFEQRPVGGRLCRGSGFTPHALRPAGGARGVDQRRTKRTRRIVPWGRLVAPLVPPHFALTHCAVARRQTERKPHRLGRRDHQQGHAGRYHVTTRREQVRMNDQNAGGRHPRECSAPRPA